MASVSVKFTTKALYDVRKYRAWSLSASVTDPVETNGVDNDPNIFVMKTSKGVSGDREEFSHVASLYEMNNLPSSKSDVPPKTAGFYRSSLLELEFENSVTLDAAKESITSDVNLLINSASKRETVSTESVVSEAVPYNALSVRFGVSDLSLNALNQTTVDGFSYSVLEDEDDIGHSGTLSPNEEYIYVMYPAELDDCTFFSIGGFVTSDWPKANLLFEDPLDPDREKRAFTVYRSNNKLGIYPGTVSYELY